MCITSYLSYHRKHHSIASIVIMAGWGFAMMANTAPSQRSRVCYPSSLGLDANVSRTLPAGISQPQDVSLEIAMTQGKKETQEASKLPL